MQWSRLVLRIFSFVQLPINCYSNNKRVLCTHRIHFVLYQWLAACVQRHVRLIKPWHGPIGKTRKVPATPPSVVRGKFTFICSASDWYCYVHTLRGWSIAQSTSALQSQLIDLITNQCGLGDIFAGVVNWKALSIIPGTVSHPPLMACSYSDETPCSRPLLFPDLQLPRRTNELPSGPMVVSILSPLIREITTKRGHRTFHVVVVKVSRSIEGNLFN